MLKALLCFAALLVAAHGFHVAPQPNAIRARRAVSLTMCAGEASDEQPAPEGTADAPPQAPAPAPPPATESAMPQIPGVVIAIGGAALLGIVPSFLKAPLISPPH